MDARTEASTNRFCLPDSYDLFDSWFPFLRLLRLWPPQMLVQKRKRAHTVDLVRADEIFDLAAVGHFELDVVDPLDLGVFGGDALIDADAVEVAALDHEGAGGDEGGHLGVVERAPEVPLKDFVLGGPNVAVRGPRGGVLIDPVV